MSLTVLWADHCCAVVDKPAELLSCPGRGDDKYDSVETRVPKVFPAATGSILVHRLDQPASGLMVVALTPRAHSVLRAQFEARQVEKHYVASLMGEVQGEEGVVELPFRLDVERRPYQVLDRARGKMGVTRWSVMSRGEGTTRVWFTPTTGRTHQLRLHASHPEGLGCPIAGDRLYGDPTTAPRLLLHAHVLVFTHPEHGQRLRFESPVPF